MDKISLKIPREVSAADEAEATIAVKQAVQVLQAAFAEASTEAALKDKMELQHFCHDEHPLVFNEDERNGIRCRGCREPVFGPSYSCIQCKWYYHHKSCAELPLSLHHHLHPKHPLIHSKRWIGNNNKCEVCKEFRSGYSYICLGCDFNLHSKCAFLPPTMEVEVHNHPLIRIWKPMEFTCDLCGKEGNVPLLCPPCNFGIHPSCATCLHKVKVTRHNHPLDLINSLEVHQSDSPFCRLCAQIVDTHYSLYYCTKCDYVAHLNCAMHYRNREYINLLELKSEESTESKTMMEDEDTKLDLSVDSRTYKVKKTNGGKDGTEIGIEIEHFSHEHDLKLTNEVQNNEKCNGCVRAILPPFYSCAKCRFFLHESCVKLPRKMRYLLHRHPLTLLAKSHTEKCNACLQYCNGFTYTCEMCNINYDVHCSLVSDILNHEGHKHQLILTMTSSELCSSCDSNSLQVFRCTNCNFALDFKCATLPLTARYEQHEHPFTLCCTAEDDSGEYYCDICEKERDPKHWFYYCADCSYPAHRQCILGKYPNCKFGGAYTFDCHPHPLTFIEEIKDPPPCAKCNEPCEKLIYQCTECNFNIHGEYDCLL